jgi:hypothetical protein
LALAYEQVRHEIDAVPKHSWVPMSVKAIDAYMTMVATEPVLAANRPAVAALLPGYDLTNYDRIGAYGRALLHAELAWRIADKPVADLRPQLRALADVREKLVSDLKTLATRRLVPREVTRGIGETTGQLKLAFDVLRLATTFRDHWSRVEGRCALTSDELAHAEISAGELAVALAAKKYVTPPSKTAASNTRHRAFTLFVRAWDDVRRIFCFYRWNEQDADQLVPSLYRGRGGRGKPKPAVEAGGGGGGERGVAARDQVGVAGWDDAPESG